MDPSIPYLACVVGAAALFIMLRPGKRQVRLAGGVVGIGVFAWLLVWAGRVVGNVLPGASGGAARTPEVFFVIFSLIAVASAVRMITHSRPVYSALYFIMVVLSSAALFLFLQAEFMAFALVIVYAGAILITYMFVLMLAQQAPDPQHPDAQPEYDRVPREPLAAVVVGFIMLSLLTHMVYAGMVDISEPASANAARARIWQQLETMPAELERVVQQVAPGATIERDPMGRTIRTDGEKTYVLAKLPGHDQPDAIQLPESAMPNNVQLVGLDLVAKFPVSLELAGVILLMAMFGAVVMARKQIELGEDEVREAAGMTRLALHSDDFETGDGRAAR